MATRTIVTSQPDVACDVCERRLLRGEQPDVFLAAGRRRIVCELCAPRAAHEGWMRESDSQSLSLPPMRATAGSQPVRPAASGRASPQPKGMARPLAERSRSLGRLVPTVCSMVIPRPAPRRSRQARPRRTRSRPSSRIPKAQDARSTRPSCWAWEAASALVGPGSETAGAQEQPSSYVEQAIAVFNASEFPRRVAGVARSLGAPVVNVRSAEHLSSVVSIVVAWELCWYRYEVDLSEPVVEAQVIAQGTELGELPREDRRANAAAGESGTLALAAV